MYEGVLFEKLAHIVKIKERFIYLFVFVVCTFKNAIQLYEIKIDVQKGALRFREISDSRFVSSNSHFHP